MLMCGPCWQLVSAPTQAEVYRTVKLRGSRVDASWGPWWRAQAFAIVENATRRAVQFKNGRTLAEYLAHELAFADKLEGKAPES